MAPPGETVLHNEITNTCAIRGGSLRPDRWYVHGKAYDLGSFVDRHPGGRRAILLGKGRDCTELFESYHIDLPTAELLNKFLDAEASKDAPPVQFSFEENGFYKTLRARTRGYFETNGSKAGYLWGTVFWIHMLVMLISAWEAFFHGSIFFAVLYGILRGLMIVRDTHASSHFAWTKNSTLNHFVYLISMAHAGSTPAQWHAKHVVAHHAETNMWSTDEDTMYPIKRVVADQPPLWFHKYQHYYMWIVVYPFTTLFWTASDLTKFMTAVITKTECVEGITEVRHENRLAWIETFCVLFYHQFHRIYFPLIVLPFQNALAVIVLSEVCTSLWFVLQFVVNHEIADVMFTHNHNNSTEEAAKGNDKHPQWPCSQDPNKPEDWGYHQVATSHNYSRLSFLALHGSGGLNTQIEHHLFPSVHFSHYLELGVIVKKTCEEFNVPYSYSSDIIQSLFKHHMLLKYFSEHERIEDDSKKLLTNVYPKSVNKEYDWTEVAQHRYKDDCWISVRDKVYDVTTWISKHPGGEDMIVLNGGKDATQLFECYHFGSTSQAETILKKYEIGTLKSSEYPMFPVSTGFYASLQTKVDKFFRERNADPKFRPVMLFVAPAIAFGTIFFYFLACYSFLQFGSYNLSAFFAVVAGVFSALTCLYSVHEGSHCSTSHSPLLWRIFGATNDYVNGGAFYTWLHQHLLGHHPFTSITSHDPDIYTNDPDIRRIKEHQPVGLLYSMQHIYMPFFLYGFLSTKFRINDLIAFNFTKINGVIRMNDASDWHFVNFWVGKLFWFTYRFLIPLQFIGLWPTLVFYSITEFICSVYLANVFQVNHVVGEVIWPQVDKNNKIDMDWGELQVRTSVDYAHNCKISTFLSGSLNYQVVHHLFPGVCQLWYPELAPIVAQTCKEFNIPYVIQPTFVDAWMAHYNYLKKMGTISKPNH